ncbi:type I methionyl aminopeptidase [bacterium]|nr:type I methionyl aminopeptidase [bacterium]
MIIYKSKREIAKMRESGRIVAEILERAKEAIKPGITTLELDVIAKQVLDANKAESAFLGYSMPSSKSKYPGHICVSINEEVVHGIPDNREIREGDLVSVDVGVLKNQFYGDAARTFKVGEIDPPRLNLFNTTARALELAINIAKAGNELEDIARVIQTTVEDQGFSVVRDLVGHGIGRNLHEEPQVPNFTGSGLNCPLREGMVIAIEPMVNMGTFRVKTASNGWTIVTSDGKPSAHFENTIAITGNGSEILTIL